MLARGAARGAGPTRAAIAGALAYDSARPGRGGRRRRSSSPWPSIASWSRRTARSPATAATTGRARGSTRSSPPAVHAGRAAARPARPRPLVEPHPRRARGASCCVVQEHIAAGDIYQANLSQRFACRGPRAAWRLYAAPAADQPRAVRRLPARGRARDRVRLAGAAAERGRRPRHHAAHRRHAPALRRPRAPTARWPRSCCSARRSGPST